MIKQFLNLEWKAFFRSASFKVNLALKILMGLGALWMTASFALMGAGLYFGLNKAGMEPLETVNQFLLYYLVADMVTRYFLHKMPVVNIKPMLLIPFKKSKIVKFALGKTVLSFFNWVHAFLFVPFSVVLLAKGYDPLGVIGWHLAIFAFIYINNFINVFLNDKTVFIVIFATAVAALGGLQYYGIFDITEFTQPLFHGLYTMPWTALFPIGLLIAMAVLAYNYFKKRLYLDEGLSKKQEIASSGNMDWLNRFGKLSIFLKNDIKLILRNKRSKMTVIMSVMFLFYGLLFFGEFEAVKMYKGPFMRMFASVFITGGFLFNFGQFVPSWDSAYYPLMMTQNIRYKEYLQSKWWLVVMATIVSTIVAAPYLYFGWETYVAIIVGAIFNIGVNAHLVLLGGAYIKTPIDLTSGKKAFGDKSSFNIKTLLISLPKMLGPMALYAIGHFTVGPVLGFALVAVAGIIGLAFRNAVFNMIIKIYKTEKYKTLAAYKQNN